MYKHKKFNVKIKIVAIIFLILVIVLLIRYVVRRSIQLAKKGQSNHMLNYPEWYSGKFPEYAFPPSENHAKQFENKVKEGYNFMKTKKIIIAGLARDIEKNIGINLERLESIGKYFEEYKILVFENDSKDATRKIIEEFEKRNSNVKLVNCEQNNCNLLEEKAVDEGIISKKRFTKMANLRNRYLNEIRQKYSNYNYMLIVDLDLTGPISEDGLATCFYYKDWHAIAALGLVGTPFTTGNSLSYYDSLAYVPLGSKPKDQTYISTLYHTIKTFVKNFPKREAELMQVESAFAGACVYDLEIFIKNPDLLYTGEHCEHVTLHAKMKEKGFGRIFINPAFLLLHAISVSEKTKSKIENILFK